MINFIRSKPRLVLIAFGLLVILLSLLTGCASIESQPFFVEGHVILSGRQAQINDLVDRAPTDLGVELKPVHTTDLGYREQFLPLFEVGDARQLIETGRSRIDPSSPDSFARTQEVVLALYEFDVPDVGAAETARVVNELNAAGATMNPRVFADLNYHSGAASTSQCGSPYIVGGSPYIVGGSPYIVGGSPYIVGGSPGSTGGAIAADPSDFVIQWAQSSVDLAVDPRIADGTGVILAVFDTSPFARRASYEKDGLWAAPVAAFDELESENWVMNWQAADSATGTLSPIALTGSTWEVSPALRLTDSNLRIRVIEPPFDNADSIKPLDEDAEGKAIQPAVISDHALFVTGLAHLVAPEAELYLVQVLNEYGCGDMYTLVSALHSFTRHVLSMRLEPILAEEGNSETAAAPMRLSANAIYNLSLGIRQPTKEQVAGWLQQMLDDGVPEKEAQAFHDALVAEVFALHGAVFDAFARGVVVVAASGNDSSADAVALADMPAGYGIVLGVGASNRAGQRTCYSNNSDFLAPGGDGEGLTCAPNLNDCPGSDPPNCDYGVISWTPFSSTGFSYWSGTSFASPIVSGLGALLISEADPDPKPGYAATLHVVCAIKAGVSSEGLISVSQSIQNQSSCLAP